MSTSLRDLYQIEFEQHSATLVQGLHGIAKHGIGTDSRNELMRAAHSLKGAARLVGLKEVSDNAHTLEAHLKEISDGAVSGDDLLRLRNELMALGIRFEHLREESVVAPSAPSQNLLHVHPDKISNLIFLASDLAVVARRIYSELSTQVGHPSGAAPELEQEIERIYSLAHTMQEATYDLRLIRLGEITGTLRAIIDATANATGKRVRFRQINASALVDRQLIPIIEPCLIQILKNAVDHGIESADLRRSRGKAEEGLITITGKQIGANLHIIISDDGGGLHFDSIREKVIERGLHSRDEASRLTDRELIEFLFLPGFTTKSEVSEFSGRGFGLDIVRSRLQEIGGALRLESSEGRSTEFTLIVPSQIASFRSLLFRVAGGTAAVPLAYIERVLGAEGTPRHDCDGVPCITWNGELIPIVEGESFFVGTESSELNRGQSYIVLASNGKRRVLSVGQLIGEEETVLKRLDARFEQQPRILGTALGRDNSIITIINVDAVLADPIRPRRMAKEMKKEDSATDARILVVDDSLTVRELERRIIISAGLRCETAVDGLDGLQKLRDGEFDLIVTDLDMPRMNGVEFVREIRKGGRTIPIVVVSYKERATERDQVLSEGANEFLSKGSFKDHSFITAIKGLLGIKGAVS